MAPAPTGLVLTDTRTLAGSVLSSFLANFGNSTTLSSVAIVTQSGSAGGRLDLPSSSVDVVLSLAENPGHHTAAFLAELARVIRSSGKLVVQEPVGRRSIAPEEEAKLGAAAASLQTQAGLERALLFAGFSGAAGTSPVAETGLASQWTGVTPASIGSTQGALLQPVAIKAQKPAWETGKSFALKKRASVVLQAPPPATPSVPVVTANGTRVKLSLDEVDEVTGSAQRPAMPSGPAAPAWAAAARDDLDDDDLVDEDSLLTAEDLAPPAAAPAVDCGDGRVGKKACKNCSCGRAEMEEKAATQKLTLDQVANPQSACGSCGLGDAFRCAGCPYRGLPAFKLGEKISLSSDLLRADV